MNYSILLDACKAHKFGVIYPYDKGTIYEAGFIYLEGTPSKDEAVNIDKFCEKWPYRMFVCLSPEWEKEMFSNSHFLSLTRYVMKRDRNSFKDKLQQYTTNIPKGFDLKIFDKAAYDAKPFRHGSNYSTFEDFSKNGYGAVLWHNGKVISSSSSYITFNDKVELDISTLPEYRRMGFALACCAQMILLCDSADIEVHWDAQNLASKKLAQKLGFYLEYEYSAFIAKDLKNLI